MIKYDCHIHTRYSSDSEAEPEEQIKRLIQLGFDGACFTDHMDYEIPIDAYNRLHFTFDPNKYFEEMEKLREKYKNSFKLLIGIEIGLRNEADVRTRINPMYTQLLNSFDFDFVIGSTHCLEYTDPYFPLYWEDKSGKEGITKYFEALLSNISTFDGYDSCGHLDYLVRYVPEKPDWNGTSSYHCSDYADIIDMILKKLIADGKALECNSAGLKYGLGFAHPKQEILKRYRELGGEMITIGSDGHKPEHVAFAFDEVREMLAGLGFKYYCVFEKRKPVINSL